MFFDRSDAGRQLAEALEFLRGTDGLLVLGIPRGGVVVAYEVARTLGAPLDVWVARKISAPGNPEFALGAVAATGDALIDEAFVRAMGVPSEYLVEQIGKGRAEVKRRLRDYRGARPPALVENKTVLLIDDGLATGATARAALRSLRQLSPRQLLLAVPVSAPEALEELEREADQIIAISTPPAFRAVGQFYEEFDQTTDAEVVDLLQKAEGDAASGES